MFLAGKATAKSVKEVIAGLDGFEPAADVSSNVEKLYELLHGFRDLRDREKAMQAMFALLERYPETEFGSPGPLVHELEAISGYELLLERSLSKLPTYLTVWMLSRFLDRTKDVNVHRYWLKKLNDVVDHPGAADYVRESAFAFIRYQRDPLIRNTERSW